MKWKTVWTNDEIVVDIDDSGNYRISFFRDNHYKDEILYTTDCDLVYEGRTL